MLGRELYSQPNFSVVSDNSPIETSPEHQYYQNTNKT